MSRVLPPSFQPFGADGPTVYLAGSSSLVGSTSLNTPPTLTTDGTFNTGDWVVNPTPVSGSAALWVCTSGTTYSGGAVLSGAVWRALTLNSTT